VITTASQLGRERDTYVARRERVVRADGTALLVGDAGIGVVRRGVDGRWRFVVTLLRFEDPA
jgi:hypothetical protein